MTIQNAIRDVRDALMSGTDPDVAVAQAAEDYGLNPVLVVRKIQEQSKIAVEEYVATCRAREVAAEQGVAASHADALERAIKKAHTSVTAFNFDCDPQYRRNARLSEDAVGKTFTSKDELYVFAGLRGGASRWPFAGIRVSDGETFRFGHTHSAIVGQL